MLQDELKEHEIQLNVITQKYVEAAREAAKARLIYDLDWAETVSKISHECAVQEKKMTVQEKEAETTKRCFEKMEAARLAEAELDGLKKHLDTLQAMLSSVQTRAKLEQIELSLAGGRV